MNYTCLLFSRIFLSQINKQTLTIQKLVDKIDELLRGGNNENE